MRLIDRPLLPGGILIPHPSEPPQASLARSIHRLLMSRGGVHSPLNTRHSTLDPETQTSLARSIGDDLAAACSSTGYFCLVAFCPPTLLNPHGCEPPQTSLARSIGDDLAAACSSTGYFCLVAFCFFVQLGGVHAVIDILEVRPLAL